MLAKLRLDQTATFEKLVGAKEISKMLVSFIGGRVHPLGIGAEQGGIEKWDDLVIQKKLNHITHIQIKRQTGAFGTTLDECERNTVTRKSGKTEPRDLSELDETIKSLGIWIITKKNSDNVERDFHLKVYDGGVEIKKGFKIKDLVNIIVTHFRPDTSTPAGIKSLWESDLNMKKCKQWLESWCDISNFDQIFTLFKVLSISYSNTESTLKKETKDNLRNVFKDESVDEVYSKIVSYTSENSSFTGAIRPRHLLFVLKDQLRPEIIKWTKFQINGSNWNISGIHDLADNNEIERPSVVVPALWCSDNSSNRQLRIDGTSMDDCLVSKSLMRISLHPQGSFDIYCTDKPSWVNSIKTKTGGTIGLTENDLIELRLADGLEISSQIDQKVLFTITEQEAFAKVMNDEMYVVTFKLLKTRMTTKIRGMNSGDLRNEVEKRWSGWTAILEGDIEKQQKLFAKLLHPRAEGESISGELRVGPKTVDLLKEALFLLLVISVCMSDKDSKNTWESVTDKLKMTAIGLEYWSGPADGPRNVIRIDDDEGNRKLLENEMAQIIIISKSELSENEFFQDDIFGEIRKLELLTHPNYPQVLILNNRKLTRKIKNGDIVELKRYFQSNLDEYEHIIEHAVNKVVDGVVV